MTGSQKDLEKKANAKLRKILRLIREKAPETLQGPWKKHLRTRWMADCILDSARSSLKANRKYRKKNYPTDILSFPAPEPFFSQGYLGSLLICLPVLRTQAKEQGHSAEIELEILLVHGVLHLFGHDHDSDPKSARTMARLEHRLLELLRRRSANGLIARTVKSG